MTRLQITAFTCIDHADIVIGDMTILIGPQASGKSVISKLVYFFNELIGDQPYYAQRIVDLKSFRQMQAEEFRLQFPPSAWGKGLFRIRYQIGPAEIIVSRRRVKGEPSDSILIKTNSYLTDLYNTAFAKFKEVQVVSADDSEPPTRRSFEQTIAIRDAAEEKLLRDLDPAFSTSQLFVPAGRSFFTTVVKSMATFDRGILLDPATRSFGLRFARLRDRLASRQAAFHPSQQLASLTQRLFGGQIIFGPDAEYVQTADGRQLPFSILSSGQQELLPMWLILDSYDPYRGRRIRTAASFIYIEEPEAHLFPDAQSILFEHLATLIADRERQQHTIFITTHSPYLLTKANNLILAGSILSEHPEAREAVGKIEPASAALRPKSLTAYAIVDKKVVSILEDDGLVNGAYLDAISSDLSESFLKLLQLQVGFNESVSGSDDQSKDQGRTTSGEVSST